MWTVQVNWGFDENIANRGYRLNVTITNWGNTDILKLIVGLFFLNAKRHNFVIFLLLSTYINYFPAKALSLIHFVNSLISDQAKMLGVIWIHTD